MSSVAILSICSTLLHISSDVGVFLVCSLCLAMFCLSGWESGEFVMSGLFVLEESNLAFVILTLLVWSVVLFLSESSGNSFCLSLSCISSVLFFLSNDLFVMFICFEVSVAPLMYVILVESNTSERISASLYIILYTIASSPPFLVGALWASEKTSLTTTTLSSSESESIILVFLGLSFLVNVPLYLLHSWLPRAHVEAPLEGSMLLAGVLLNLGVFGMVRIVLLSPSLYVKSDLATFLQVMCVCGGFYAFVVALSSDDMKKSVAYSSIGHINLSLSSLLSGMCSGKESCLIVSFVHGLVACSLFWNVTTAYCLTGSRSILLNNGVFSNTGALQLVSFGSWALNFSPPLTFPFVGEVWLICTVCSVSGYLLGFFLGCAILLGSCFSVLVYVFLSHSSESPSWNGNGVDLVYLGFSVWVVVMAILMFFFPPQFFPGM